MYQNLAQIGNDPTFVPKTEPYYWFLNPLSFPTFRRQVKDPSLYTTIDNGKIIRVRSQEEELVEKVKRDVKALATNGIQSDYSALEKRLVSHIEQSVRSDAARSRDINRSGDAYLTTLDYIQLLQTFDGADIQKVENLILAVMRAFIKKTGSYATIFAPEDSAYSVLWARAFTESSSLPTIIQ